MCLHQRGSFVHGVALRKESVDRNEWCEERLALPFSVALRKESVDRNIKLSYDASQTITSLSARRAWIEIWTQQRPLTIWLGRSPQGERG